MFLFYYLLLVCKLQKDRDFVSVLFSTESPAPGAYILVGDNKKGTLKNKCKSNSMVILSIYEEKYSRRKGIESAGGGYRG